MKTFLIVLGCITLSWVIYLLFCRRTKLPTSKSCSHCENESAYGYAEMVNGLKKNIPLCRKCLISQLESDYLNFAGRAVVIQPAPGPPCYSFHSNSDWSKSFKHSKIDDDVRSYLLRMDLTCKNCGERAHFLWIGSAGLTQYNFGNVLKKGFAETLLPMNPPPLSLCKTCCVRRIAGELNKKQITYLEVLGPRGNEDGFVMPMAY